MTRSMNWDSGEFKDLDVDGMLLKLTASAAELAIETEDGTVPESLDEITAGRRFRIPMLIPEGVESGDGRKMAENALSTRELPISLLWQPQTGDGHNGSFIVGRIDTIERLENGLGNAEGVFDTGPYGREAERLVDAKMLRGVSADLDEFEATVDGEEVEDISAIKNEKMVVNKARVMAATLVAKPAFQECTIELVSDESSEEELPVTDGVYEETPPDADAAEFALSVLTASAAPVNPPQAWFENPNLDKATPLTVDDDGRVYGHVATWETDHIGFNYGVRPPRSRSNYAYFRTGLVRTNEGEDVAVGQLTLAGGHADLAADAHSAVKHYDDTASAVADVTAGEDQFGIWVSGGLRPSVTPEQVRTLRASAPSGDWRPVNGTLELVAVCQVNVPGFPIARARVASGAVMSLVAAGASTLHALRKSETQELASRLERLEQSILAQRKKELAAKIEPAREERRRQLREAATKAREAMAPELHRRAEMAARAEETRKRFRELALDVKPDFKEALHPRDDEGKFRQVLGKLSDLLKLEADFEAPDAEEAKAALEKAADLEEKGDTEGAKREAGDAAAKIESAAEKADSRDGDNPEAKAGLGNKLHEIAEEVGVVVSETADGEVKDADGDAEPEAKDSGPVDKVKPKTDVVPGDKKPKTDTLPDDGPVDEPFKLTEKDLPGPIKDLIDMLIDELGENVDPRTIISRMEGQLKHWLEGKGFQSPEQMAEWIIKIMQKPVQPDIAQ